jgi:hypothetical protein
MSTYLRLKQKRHSQRGISALEIIVATLLLTAISSGIILTMDWVGGIMRDRQAKTREHFDKQRRLLMGEEEIVVERDIDGGYIVVYKTG